MALYICKCLNVTLESDKLEDNDNIQSLDLSATEQRDIFFNEKLLVCSLSSLKIHIAQLALTGHRTVGRWTIHTCLACKEVTHAVLNDKSNTVLIPKSIQATYDHVNNLKRSKNFSPVFNLLVPEVTNDFEMKENVDTTNVGDKPAWSSAQQVIGTLNKQMNLILQSQLEFVEETVRQFRDQKYAEFEAYRERAQREHKILANIVSKAKNNEERRIDITLDNGPPSPQLPPLQRRRLSSIKDAKKFAQYNKPQRQHQPVEDDSLDAEDIFDLEGTAARHMDSDHGDYDSDLDTQDEGYAMPRRRAPESESVAYSLPIDMPKFPGDRPQSRELYDEEEPQDIAASIKALARSVHGDVFELPRPRFSTQI